MAVDVRQFTSTASGASVLGTQPTTAMNLLHTLVDEGMSASDAVRRADYWFVTGQVSHVRMKVDQASFPANMNEITSIKIGFDHLGTPITGNPRADFNLFTNGTLHETLEIALNTGNVATKAQVVFPQSPAMSKADYQTLEWEIDYLAAGPGGDEPDPYQG